MRGLLRAPDREPFLRQHNERPGGGETCGCPLDSSRVSTEEHWPCALLDWFVVLLLPRTDARTLPDLLADASYRRIKQLCILSSPGGSVCPQGAVAMHASGS